MRRLALTALAASAIAATPAFGAGTPPPTGTTPTTTPPAPVIPPKPKYIQLSNETTFSRWAYTNLTLKVRKSPSARGKAIGKLHFNTEDGPPEIYLALQEYTNGADVDWVEVRIPGRPNGRIGWVPREGLG